jgi:hypothetical protein
MNNRTVAVRTLAAYSAVTFLLGAALHAGVRVPLGVTTLDEPTIVPATIVEGICGFAFVVALWAIATRRPWARLAIIGANVIGLAGVGLGMAALAAGRGPRTTLNDDYHRTMVVLLLTALVLLLAPRQQTGRDEPGADGTHNTLPTKG